MARYIRPGDITDKLIKPFVEADQSYLTRADNAFLDLANSFGIGEAYIKTDPIPFRVIEYLRARVGFDVCEDNAGIDNKKAIQQAIEFDTFAEKLNHYKKRLNDTRSALTYEIITGDADTQEEYAGAAIRLYRG